MKRDNPFNQLGLNKELVTFLAQTGKLDEFLHKYIQFVQPFVHPDRGGNNDLSVLVNSACSELRGKSPRVVDDYIAGMQNGSAEYLGVIEGLVREVEKLKEVEKRYEQLRADYAQLLNKNSTGFGSEVKTPKSRTSPKADEPKVRTPPKAAPRVRVEETERESAGAETTTAGKYTRIKSSTYALGVEHLRKLGLEPFSFKENLQARLEQPDLYGVWLDSRAGIAYKKDSALIKIIPDCEHLKHIPAEFKQPYIKVKYSDLRGIELDTRKFKCDQKLTKAEIVKHPVWLTLADDKALLGDYVEATFNAYTRKYGSTDKLMGFWKIDSQKEDQLRALYLDNLLSYSLAVGSDLLYYSGSFLLR